MLALRAIILFLLPFCTCKYGQIVNKFIFLSLKINNNSFFSLKIKTNYFFSKMTLPPLDIKWSAPYHELQALHMKWLRVEIFTKGCVFNNRHFLIIWTKGVNPCSREWTLIVHIGTTTMDSCLRSLCIFWSW